MPELTLLTLARNEEEFLPDCLASVRDVVDRMVVVDTGSTDATVAIAEAAGAEVVRHPWGDDFAAARNAGLGVIESGFVLVLDADERLARTGARALRAAVEADDLDCGALPLYNARSLDDGEDRVLNGGALSPPILLGRLLRRTPDLAWEGAVHEHLTSWAAAHPRRRTLECPIVHLGEVPELRVRRRKSERNLRLLEKRVRSEPANAFALAALAQERLRAGDREGALRAAEDAWALARQSPANPAGIWPATLLGQLRLECGAPDRARSVLEQARELFGDHPNLDYLVGCAFEREWLDSADRTEAQLAAAEQAFRRAGDWGDRPSAIPLLSGATTWNASTRRATVLLLAGRFEEARERFEIALAANPGCEEARWGRLEADWESQAGPLPIAGIPETSGPDYEALMALDAHRRGDARDFLSRTRSVLGHARAGRPPAPHRWWKLRRAAGAADAA